jgi:hypothetical protein
MQACKPGSVLLPNTWKKCLSFIWPVCCHADRAAYPTPMEYRSILLSEPLLTGAYLAFQLVRFTMPPVSPLGRWALTPPFHLFLIPTKLGRGSLFSVALSVPVPIAIGIGTFLLGSTMLCVARTFLPDPDSYRDSGR